MKKVYIKFPKVGLGNMLLVWARAIVFSRLNNISYTTSSWWGLRWGALLRKEKRKRLYWKYFLESSLTAKLRIWLFSKRAEIVYDPPVITLISSEANTANQLFVFQKVNIEDDLFRGIRLHQQIIREELEKILHPRIKKIIQRAHAPVISAHIRRGDFKIGNPITALSFFTEAIQIIRETVGEEWQTTIFSDATYEELIPILKLPAVSLAENKPDIADILLMSKSKVIILSQSSSFSYWSAFLSDALVVIPMNDWQKKIKNASETGLYREVRWLNGDINSTASFRNAAKFLRK